MKRLVLSFGLVVFIGQVASVQALTIDELELSDGRSGENYILKPVFDTQGIESLQFGKVDFEYDPESYVVYKQTKSLLGDRPKFPHPHYVLDPSIDLGSLLVEALTTEAKAMGFDVVPENGSGAGWSISGKLHEVDVGIKQIPFGMTLFFSFMEVDLDVRHSGGEKNISLRFPLFNMSQFYNAGMGLQDEVREALAGFLIESAQEVVARLNREVFKAPPHPETVLLATDLRPNQKDPENHLLRIGLSGYSQGVPLLLEILAQEKDESDRVHVINALANIGSPAVISVLAGRYEKEDEDCRYFTLKAMSYIGTNEAMEVLADYGVDDGKLACRVLAKRALEGRAEIIED